MFESRAAVAQRAMSVNEQTSMETVLKHLDASWFALARACAWSSRLERLPQTARLQGLHESHVMGLFPASYHLTTAPGAARVMVEARTLSPAELWLVVACTRHALPFLVNATDELDRAYRSLNQRLADDGELATVLRNCLTEASRWTRRAVKEAIEAMSTLHDLVGEDEFALLLKDSALAAEPAVSFRKRRGLAAATTIGPAGNDLPAFDVLQSIKDLHKRTQAKGARE